MEDKDNRCIETLKIRLRFGALPLLEAFKVSKTRHIFLKTSYGIEQLMFKDIH